MVSLYVEEERGGQSKRTGESTCVRAMPPGDEIPTNGLRDESSDAYDGEEGSRADSNLPNVRYLSDDRWSEGDKSSTYALAIP